MASAINSDNGVVSGSAGLKSSADSSGVLDLQTNGTTAISISASQVVSFANQPTYTGGTANGVLYLNGSKAVTTGTALTFDGSQLDIPLGSAGTPSLSTPTDPNTGMFFPAADTIAFAEGGVEAMRLDSSGDLQLGTTTGLSPSAGRRVLTMNGSSDSFLLLATGGTRRGGLYTQGTQLNVVNDTAILVLETNGSQRARIDGSGRVGFGTQGTTSDRLIDASFQGATTTGANQFGLVLNPTYPTTPTSTIFNMYTGPNLTAGTTVTTVYGHYLEAINASGSTVTNRWGLYQAGSSDRNLFSGNVTVNNGITFPATQVASANANTLDDYEEGSWSPVLTGIGSGTINQQFGAYTKIGNLVFVTGKLGWTGKTGTDALNITGLPFNAADASDTGSRSSCLPEGDWQNINDLMDLNGMFRINGTSLQGVIDNGSGFSIIMTAANVGAAGEFNFSLTYRASA